MSIAWAGGSRQKFAADGPVAVTDFTNLFALVECTPDLSSLDCSDCIEGLINHIPQCCDNKSGAVFFAPSCHLKYETKPFFNAAHGSSSPPLLPPSNDSSSRSTGKEQLNVES